MKNVTITEISGSDVDFDQRIDSDEVTALAGGVAINGSVSGSAINTGKNTGIMAGDDVDLDHSTVGNGNVQFNDSKVGAFAQGGDATNIQGHNLNLGSGDLIEVDTEGGDAQVVNGHDNQLFGDIDVDASGSDGPANFVFGNDNRATALEDNSTNIEDSFNLDKSVDGSHNTEYEDSFNKSFQDNDTTERTVEGSYNETHQDNDTKIWDWDSSFTDSSVHEDNDTFSAEVEVQDVDVDMWKGMHNDINIEL
ncbi:MAG: hypothetical protein ACKV2O_13225 [Acidimicrobiales bacterium]